MEKDKQLNKDEIWFKTIEEEETNIKTKFKASTNFVATKSYSKLEGVTTPKEKKEFVK